MRNGSTNITPVKGAHRDHGGDVGPSKHGVEARPSKNGGKDALPDTGDDEEFWRIMRYEEQRLKEAGKDPNDISSLVTRVHTNFLLWVDLF